MFDITGLIGSKYGTEKRPLEPVDQQHLIDPKQAAEETLYSQGSVVQINSTYLELIDRWNYIRGSTTWWCSLFGGLSIAIFFDTIYSISLSWSQTESDLLLWLDYLIFIVCLLIVFFCFSLIRSEQFTYTYYPIRFNRKLQKVYVIRPNKKIDTFDWNELIFYYKQTGSTREKIWDVRAATLDEDEKVKATFSLPYTNYAVNHHLKGHWEFVRRYMSASDAELGDVVAAVHQVYPLHKGRGSLKSLLQRSWYQFRTDQNLEAPIPKESRLWVAIETPWWLMSLVGRLISYVTCWTPRFPQWVQAECATDPNDPYDLAQHPPEAMRLARESWLSQLGYAVLVLAVGLVACSVILLGIDAIGAVKGHESNLLGQFWGLILFWR